MWGSVYYSPARTGGSCLGSLECQLCRDNIFDSRGLVELMYVRSHNGKTYVFGEVKTHGLNWFLVNRKSEADSCHVTEFSPAGVQIEEFDTDHELPFFYSKAFRDVCEKVTGTGDEMFDHYGLSGKERDAIARYESP